MPLGLEKSSKAQIWPKQSSKHKDIEHFNGPIMTNQLILIVLWHYLANNSRFGHKRSQKTPKNAILAILASSDHLME